MSLNALYDSQENNKTCFDNTTIILIKKTESVCGATDMTRRWHIHVQKYFSGENHRNMCFPACKQLYATKHFKQV